ncbi:MAG TPA: precorrin-3B C(17)-methyltransferase [Polyangia bacterium]
MNATSFAPLPANGPDLCPARLSRLAGALLLQVGHLHHLIGNLKRPCHFEAHGFVTPKEPVDALVRPSQPLERHGSFNVTGPHLSLGDFPLTAAPMLAARIAERLLITRNGSVSDRLWRLLLADPNDPDADLSSTAEPIDARWLVEIPHHLWNIVREAVLTCS